MKYIVLPFLLLFSSLASASSSGTVFISGVIGGGGICDLSLELQTLRSICFRGGRLETLSMPVVDFAQQQQLEPLDKADLNWLDKQQSKAVLVISYR
ncbi:hypothetical protein ACFSFZ_09305 [Mixta tenebrionis]|uniref:Type 1 fimbrial protein n=1 Tax=Mixta tenebrionis TaxID=2562439 RepID=A0A506VA18_9GAMM|nr:MULTISPECIES: hypothetical protein [Mixta]QHM74890.1 hypothetical protein C7M52_00834 [Mixta theicola]TPW42804.1 hypothetical protein FKM52_08520 [Mixta tenebrionis]